MFSLSKLFKKITHFNETANYWVRKQFSGYITYWDVTEKEITTFVGSFFVGHCTNGDLLSCLQTVMIKWGSDVTLFEFGYGRPKCEFAFSEKIDNPFI